MNQAAGHIMIMRIIIKIGLSTKKCGRTRICSKWDIPSTAPSGISMGTGPPVTRQAQWAHSSIFQALMDREQLSGQARSLPLDLPGNHGMSTFHFTEGRRMVYKE